MKIGFERSVYGLLVFGYGGDPLGDAAEQQPDDEDGSDDGKRYAEEVVA